MVQIAEEAWRYSTIRPANQQSSFPSIPIGDSRLHLFFCLTVSQSQSIEPERANRWPYGILTLHNLRSRLAICKNLSAITVMMAGVTQSNIVGRSRQLNRTKAKTGCRTCKIRKVKCDEGRPACRRCISTGRVCDGYGVWGGGGKVCWFLATSTNRSISSYPSECSSLLYKDGQAQYYFEWFWTRTITKIPGPFPLEFWSKFLAQVSLTEPAILHSILALSSVHKRDIFDQDGGSNEPDDKERFYLQHYSKAITHLQRYLTKKDRNSARIALITCLVFVSLEYLRGHFVTAQSHLRNGLEILKDFQGPVNQDYGNLSSSGSVASSACSSSKFVTESTDDWILEAFSRLQLLVDLFNVTYEHRPVPYDDTPSISADTRFNTLSIAWRHLERLFSRIIRLTDKANRLYEESPFSFSDLEILVQEQQGIQGDLSKWREVFDACRTHLLLKDWEGIGSGLLFNYHSMASIMADACLSHNDESIFDASIDKFVALVEQTTRMWKLRHSRLIPGHDIDMPRSTIDIGWIPPLYHTAIKCRNHRIRLQAIRFIESAPHREGMWDSRIAACIARKVVEIEEGDFYKGINFKDDFSLETSPQPLDLSIAALPQSRRLHELKIIMPDGDTNRVSLFYRGQGRSWEQTEVVLKRHSPNIT